MLLHRHRLRQIPWLVNVSALEHGDVVGQQLQRDGVEDRRQGVVDVWHVDHVGALAIGHAQALGGGTDSCLE